ncbi:hypothetical protein [Marinospirillum perlucidum]|uniref:hypothetical protein n=1 Tax=Marinospirillum perlucidum TaxID=1982602 RepID=UPI000DF13E72|nr:hypothetical protein [Marinospirillum perlucidum]
MMKRILVSVLLTVTGMNLQAAPIDAVGLVIGEPTGLTAKKWLDDDRALTAGLGWSLGRDTEVYLSADYLFHEDQWLDSVTLPRELDGRLAPYWGVGGRFELDDEAPRENQDDDWVAGVRFPVGLTYLFAQSPFDVFIEIAPGMDLLPSTDLRIEAALGGRFYF